jgi:tRNA wybutosine-synthesizing protein 4
VDVDYPELMITKTTILKETTALKELVKPKAAAGPGFVTEAEQYYGIGCDLGDVRGLDAAFKYLRDIEKALVLCVAEVSVTYMHPDAADALTVWARALSDGKPGYPTAESLLRSRCDILSARTVSTRWPRSSLCKNNVEAL